MVTNSKLTLTKIYHSIKGAIWQKFWILLERSLWWILHHGHNLPGHSIHVPRIEGILDMALYKVSGKGYQKRRNSCKENVSKKTILNCFLSVSCYFYSLYCFPSQLSFILFIIFYCYAFCVFDRWNSCLLNLSLNVVK